MGQARRQRIAKRRRRALARAGGLPCDDASNPERGRGERPATFAARWVSPSRDQLRALRAAVRRGWLSGEDLTPFVAGIMDAIADPWNRRAIAGVWVFIEAERQELADIEKRLREIR